MDRTATDVRFETGVPSRTGTAVVQRDAISGLAGMANDHSSSGTDEAPGIQGAESGTRPVGSLPDYVPAREAQEIHEINVLLTAMLIGTHALYFWLNANRPNLEAAKRTSLRLHRQHTQLKALVNAVAERWPDEAYQG